jgi:hypothetical protein
MDLNSRPTDKGEGSLAAASILRLPDLRRKPAALNK